MNFKFNTFIWRTDVNNILFFPGTEVHQLVEQILLKEDPHQVVKQENGLLNLHPDCRSFLLHLHAPIEMVT